MSKTLTAAQADARKAQRRCLSGPHHIGRSGPGVAARVRGLDKAIGDEATIMVEPMPAPAVQSRVPEHAGPPPIHLASTRAGI